jgi:hypothetical protein
MVRANRQKVSLHKSHTGLRVLLLRPIICKVNDLFYFFEQIIFGR